MPIIQPVQRPNIANLLLQGLAAGRQFQGIQQAGQESARQEKIAELASQAGQSPQALQQLSILDPARARSFRAQQAEIDERFKRERASTAAEIENLPLNDQLARLDKRIEMLNKRGESPHRTQGLRDMLASGDPQQIAKGQFFISEARNLGEQQGYLKPRAQPREQQKLAIERKLRLANIDPQSEEGQRIIRADLGGIQQKIEVDSEGNITFVSGKGMGLGGAEDLTKRTRGALEKSIISGKRNISALNRLSQQFDKDFLTYKGRGKAFVSSLKSKLDIELGEDEKQFLRNRRKFTQNVNQFFNAYRKDITGAAASMLELSSLKKAIFNTDLSPEEFQAAFDEFKSETIRLQRLNQRLLREGLSGKELSKQTDSRFLAGDNITTEDRIEEWRKKNDITEEPTLEQKQELFKLLNEEGFEL
jgi:hypothetical protein